MIQRTLRARQRGIAAVEFALVLPILVTLMVGLWEVGRMIQLQQILTSAAREGARVAAQSQTINQIGAPTQIQVDAGSPNVKQTVMNYLREAGLNVSSSEVTVEFAFTTGDTSKTQPYQGEKGQQFRVTVRLPITSLQWSAIKLTTINEISASVIWSCLVDDPFTLDMNLPSW